MDASKRRWLVAGICAVLVHLLLLLGARLPDPVLTQAAASATPLQLVFSETENANSPRQYVEQPETPAPPAIEDPTALSNVDALAADREAGAQDDEAFQSGDAEHPSVPMRAASEGDPSRLRNTADAVGELVRAVTAPKPSGAPAAPLTGDGRDNFDQPSAQRLGSGVELFGDVRLSTVAWEFAPWLQRFRAALIRNWQAPYAFHMGLIHGQQRIRVEVGRDGALLGLTLLSNQGHESLQNASLSAFRAAAPYAPLPDHFPDERLVMEWTLIYPQFRR